MPNIYRIHSGFNSPTTLPLPTPIDSILILPLVIPYPFQLFHVTILSLASPNLAIFMHSLSQLHIAF